MMGLKKYILIIMLILLSSLVAAAGDISYWNLSVYSDQWGANDGTPTSVANSASFPTFATSGTSGPNSSDFTNAFIDVGMGALNIVDDTLSVSAWFKLDNVNVRNIFACPQDGGAAGTVKYRLYVDGGTGLRFGTKTSSGSVDSTYAFSDTTSWHHVLGVYNGSTQRLYVDGVLRDTDAQTGNIVANVAGNCRIGSFSSTYTQYWDGLIDEVQVFDRALNATEISNLYNYGAYYGASNATPTSNVTNFEITAKKYWDIATINEFSVYTDENITNAQYNSTQTISTRDFYNFTTIYSQYAFLRYNNSKAANNQYIELPNQCLKNPIEVFDERGGLPNDYVGCYNSSGDEITLFTYDFMTTNITLDFLTVLYNTTNGTIITNLLTNDTDTYKLIISPYNRNNYFQEVNNTVNVSTNKQFTLKQSEYKVFVLELFSNATITNFYMRVNGTVKLNTTGNNGTIYPNEATNYQAAIFDNAGGETYHTTSSLFNATALTNGTLTFFVHGHELFVRAYSIIDGSLINNITVNISSLNITDNRELSSTTGVVNFDVIHNTYNVTLVDAEGYALNVNRSQLITIDSTKQNFTLNFTLYTTNSINFTFYDANTLELLNGTNITVTFIGETQQQNITDTGFLYVDLLTPDTYTINYEADTYRQGHYVLEVDNRTYQTISLYLQPENNTQLILLRVQDIFGTPLQNVKITKQKYVSTSWITDEILLTDFQGNAEGTYILSTVYYNHIITYNGVNYIGAINDNANKKLIYAEDVTTGLTFTIDILQSSEYTDYVTNFDIDSSLTFVNTSNITAYFRYYFIDNSGNQQTARLEVYSGSSKTPVCTGSSYEVKSSSGTIFCNIATNTSKVYYAIGYLNGFQKESLIKRFGYIANELDWGNTGFVFGFFICLVAAIMFLANPSISVLVMAGAFIMLTALGVMFKDLSYSGLILILALSFLVARIKSKSGVNG